jgi:hypothetical protein
MNGLRTVEIGYSPATMIMLAVGSVVMAAATGLIAFGVVPDRRGGPGSFHEFLAYVGLVLFSLAAALVLWRLVTTRGPVVTLTATGIRDVRIAADEIAWSAIHAIGEGQIHRQQFLVLAVDPAVEAQLRLTRSARWGTAASRARGIDGLYISAIGLKTDHQSLRLMCHDRVARAHGMRRPSEELQQAPPVEI